MNKKHVNKLIIAAIILSCVLIILGKQDKIEQLNKQLENYGYEDIELDNCYMCGKEVKLEPVGDSFHIKCDNIGLKEYGCGLSTGYYDSRAELIREWNKED